MDSSLELHFSQLLTVINSKNTEEICSQLEKLGGYVNNKVPNDDDGCTLLHEVAKLGDTEILKLFVEDNNVDVNVQDNNGSTPLHYVIERNENLEELAKMLIEAGADIVVPNKNGKTPLHILIEKQVDPKTVKSLINMKNRRREIVGKVLLSRAVCAGNAEITQLLIDYGCDIKNIGSTSLLHLAARYTIGESNFKVAKVLLKTGLDVNAQDCTKNTALHYLAKKTCNFKIIELFLDFKAQVNIKNGENEIPLFKAIESSNLEAVQLLIDHGSDVNSVSNNGSTVLHKVASCCYGNSHIQIAELLINAGADVHIKDAQGETPLFSAVRGRNYKTVQFLLDHDSDINTINNNGSTVLLQATHITQFDNNISTVEVLLKNGANVDAQDRSGKTPLHNLMRYKNINNAKTMKLLLNYKPEVNIKDNSGEIPLFAAVERRDLRIVQPLLDHGSDVNCKDLYKRTPLHFAAQSYIDSCEILKYSLVKNGTDANAIDSGKILECFVKNGADANAIDLEGRTPLLILLQKSSCSCDFKKTLKFMLKYSDINVIDQTEQEILSFIKVEEIRKIVLKHLVKLQALDLPINPAIKNSISGKAEYNDYFSKCLEELAVAKSIKLKDCWVTYFNLLTDNKKKLKNYAGNADLIEAFEKSNCVNTYPFYGSEMQENLEKGIKRRKLFDVSADILSNYCPIFGQTHLIIRDILDCCLSTKDLSKLCEENLKNM